MTIDACQASCWLELLLCPGFLSDVHVVGREIKKMMLNSFLAENAAELRI